MLSDFNPNCFFTIKKEITWISLIIITKRTSVRRKLLQLFR